MLGPAVIMNLTDRWIAWPEWFQSLWVGLWILWMLGGLIAVPLLIDS